jgi:hypothetical protein
LSYGEGELQKLAVLEESLREKMQSCGTVTDLSHSLATVQPRNMQITRENMAEGARFKYVAEITHGNGLSQIHAELEAIGSI